MPITKNLFKNIKLTFIPKTTSPKSNFKQINHKIIKLIRQQSPNRIIKTTDNPKITLNQKNENLIKIIFVTIKESITNIKY